FHSADGVELSGTYFPSAAGKKDACVLLLHDFDSKKGGNSHQDGWDALAGRLQAEGYAVLSFDFRGFGESKTVGKSFWDIRRTPHNNMVRRRKGSPDSVDHKDFNIGYYPYLVNDIAAAKAFLDRRNDAREVNSANVIVVGAGNGATLGAMWMASECRRR